MGICGSKSLLYESLSKSDPELSEIIRKESCRQLHSLELIASENYTSCAVLEANGSIFTNKYAEGYPGKRYYGGCEFIDELELLTQQRALKAFGLSSEQFGVNVQALSGSPANFAVYAGLLKPGDTIMGMKLTHGGHLTHGAVTPTGKKLSNSSIFFNSVQYGVDPESGLIDYPALKSLVEEHRPKLIIVGGSAYSRDYDYQQFRHIANSIGAYLMADIAHTSGLISANLLDSPFEYCDVVTTTTHKTLRGPRAALIFYKNSLKEHIDFSVFPGTQGGAHYNTISAVATALRQVDTSEFKDYSLSVQYNARVLSNELTRLGFTIVTGGTDNHLILIDLTPYGISGSKFEKIAEMCGVSLNKNTIPADRSALNPNGIRIGTPAMTSRGFNETDFKLTAMWLSNILYICITIQSVSESKKMIDFNKNVQTQIKHINKLKRTISDHCLDFWLPKALFVLY
jgi:glycine hydroxymethyltransferase